MTVLADLSAITPTANAKSVVSAKGADLPFLITNAKQDIIELQAKLKHGLALHQQGKLADAEHVYREVLQQQPNNFDALHLLGVIAHQVRQTERAVELIGKAIALNAKIAVAHSNLGNALLDLKRPEEALASFDKLTVESVQFTLFEVLPQ